jgi:hypothetical protein
MPSLNFNSICPGLILHLDEAFNGDQKILSAEAYRWLPKMLVLSKPQLTANGLAVVSAIPLSPFDQPQLCDKDLLLAHPFADSEEGITLHFWGLQSVLVAQLQGETQKLPSHAMPLIKAFWKYSLGLESAPIPENFQPQFAWDTGDPIHDQRDVRLELVRDMHLRMQPLIETFAKVMHNPDFALLTRVPQEIAQAQQAALFSLGNYMAENHNSLCQAAAGTTGNELRPEEHLDAIATSANPFEQCAHAIYADSPDDILATFKKLNAETKS